MKITYNKNPLNTTVELDEHEKQILWYKIKCQEMEDLLFSANYYLEPGQFYSIEASKKESDPNYYMADDGKKSTLEERCDSLLECYLSDLMLPHGGDCTCVPCSCGKCHAEQLLGINTLDPYPGKHVLVKFVGAFGENNERTIDEAIARLENYDPKANWEGYEIHVPRWKAEAAKALEYLKNYRDKHFPIGDAT